MSKSATKILSMFLALIMLFQLTGITQLTAYATETTSEELNETAVNEAEILYEDESQREEYSKKYRMTDGTWIAVVYDDAVHYQSDGEWKDIDNTLKSNTQSYRIPTESGKVTGRYTVDGFVAVADTEVMTQESELTTPIPSENPEVNTTPVSPDEPVITVTPEPTEEPNTEAVEEETPVVTEIPEASEEILDENESVPEADDRTVEDAEAEAAVESASVTEDTAEVESVSEEPETVAEEPVVEVTETPAAEDAETPKEELVPDTTDIPVVDTTPEVTETPTVEPTPEVEEDPVVEETPVPEIEEPVIESEVITENAAVELQPITSPIVTIEPIKPIKPTFKDVTEQVWTNTSNDFGISLPVNLDGESRVHVSNENYDLYFAPILESEGGNGDVSLFAVQNTAVEGEKMTLDNSAIDRRVRNVEIKARSGLTYEEVLPGVDLQYFLQSRSLKETIIVDSLAHLPETIGYTISAEGLTPVVNEDNSINFMAGENVIFCLPAPYMFDSDSAYSFEIDVSLETLNTGEYLLTYTPDEQWLSAEERVWPVSIDPVVSTPTTASNVNDSYISQGNPNTNYYAYTTVYVGNLSNGGLRTYIKFASLPSLSGSDVILAANMYMHGKGMTSGATTTISAYAITSSWESSTLTWNRSPSNESVALDYQTVTSSNWNQNFCWDITYAAKRWYLNKLGSGLGTPNYGVMLMSEFEGTTYHVQAQLGASEDPNGLKPSLIISYTSNSGLEDYWDYTSQSAGRAGTAYVNNFTGNLMVSRTDMSYGGNRMPASIGFNYNYLDNNKELGYGYGWRMNYAQLITVESSTVNGSSYTYYRWTDGDGTRRNFYASGGSWYDETGQGYVLTVNSSSSDARFTITDKQNNKLVFDSNGRLRKVVDGNISSNYVSISYKGSGEDLRISQILDGAGRKYVFTYNSSDRLSCVDYYGTGSSIVNYVNYTYNSSGALQTVSFKDGGTVTYSYSSTVMTGMTNNVTGESIVPAYIGGAANASTKSRVQTLTYKDGSTVVGSAAFTYGENYTKVTDKQGCWCVYQFNDFGNTTSVYNDRGQAVFGRYAQDIDSSNRANQLVSSSRLQDTVVNLVGDPSFERNASQWTLTNTTRDSAVRKTGGKSAKMSVGGSVSYAYSYISGKTYTISAEVKTTDTAAVQIEALNTQSGTVRSEPLSASEWTRLELTFTAASGTTVSFKSLQTGSGTVYLDDVQLETTNAASRYNMITGSDMTYLNFWTNYNMSGTDGINTISSGTGKPSNLNTQVYLMNASYYVEKYTSQAIKIPDGKTGDKYTFGVWVKTDAVAMDNVRAPGDSEIRECGIKVKATKNGTEVASETILVNDQCRDWQYLCGSLTTDGAYDTITYTLLFNYCQNTAMFDGAQLFRESYGYHYEYDDDGNVTKITDLAGNVTSYTYGNGNSDVTKITLPNNSTYSYTYNTARQLTQDQNTLGTINQYSYDSYGNLTQQTTNYSGAANSIVSGATYEGSGNMTKTVTTADRQTISYTNDLSRSLVTAVTDPMGRATLYTYDTMDRPDTVTHAGSTLDYSYANDTVSSISHSGGVDTTYNFSYGVADVLNAVNVGNTTLVSNTYNTLTWNLLSQTYANGAVWSYAYYNDANGHQTTELKSKSTTGADNQPIRYEYYYSNEGAVGRIAYYKNNVLQQVEKYYYDTADRLCRVVGVNGSVSAPTILYEYSWKYDQNNNVTAVTEKIGSTSTAYTYGYNTENLATSAAYGNTTKSFTYDGYGRGTGETVKNGDTTAMSAAWTYKTNGSYMTNQVGSYTNSWTGDSEALTYTYDANGNITAISGALNVTYTYDANDQLTLEKNTTANKAWGYEYDSGGNITKKITYTDATASAVASQEVYTYDSAWGDKLTAVGSKTVTSDASGNITAYNGWTYGWQGGRQLRSATNGTTTLSFAYNDSGLRTSKSNGTTTHSYTYNGSLLAADVTSGYALYFRYDQNGSPIGFTHVANSITTEYYYLKNLQGDIIGIVDAGGNRVATYSYDAWGNPLSQPTSGVGALNPLRYRGYQYDVESGLYYLQSRYYAPAIGRFISADAYAMTYESPIGANMFAYCLNNPVNMADDGGEWAHLAIGAAVGALVSGIVTAATSYAQTGSINWKSVAINAATGAVGGLIAATGLGAGTQAALTAVAGGVGNYVDQVATKGKDNVNKHDVIGSAVVGGVSALLGGAAGKTIVGNIDDAGQALLRKGQDKLLTGYVRKSVGQSHSALLRQGQKLYNQGNKMIHTYRGTSSVIGSFIGGGIGIGYNSFKVTVGW